MLLEKRILVYDFHGREKIGDWEVQEDTPGVKTTMTSVAVSGDGRRMLVSMNESRIRLMSVETGECLQSFEGQRQSQFIIRSGFGGADEGFVVSGSEGTYSFLGSSLLPGYLEKYRG